MKSKFNKFDYQIVESTQKGFQEVLVTFDYKGKACHYYAFIKEKPKMTKQKYIAEAKKEVATMIKNGQLAKRAKRYLNYPLKPEDKLVVVSNRLGASNTNTQTKARKKLPASVPFLVLTIVGAVLLVFGIAAIVRSFILGNWPDYVLTADDKFKIACHLYVGIGAGILGLAGLAVGIPLFIKKKKKK